MPSSDTKRCKFCKKLFDKDTNPTVKNPTADDLVRRRAPQSRDCKCCHYFVRNDENYAEMPVNDLEKHLSIESNQAEFDRRYDEWCSARRDGKRRARARGETGQVDLQLNCLNLL